jgi:hypothetical protein
MRCQVVGQCLIPELLQVLPGGDIPEVARLEDEGEIDDLRVAESGLKRHDPTCARPKDHGTFKA